MLSEYNLVSVILSLLIRLIVVFLTVIVDEIVSLCVERQRPLKSNSTPVIRLLARTEILDGKLNHCNKAVNVA